MEQRTGKASRAEGTLLGWVITFRHVGTKDYRNMMFVTLEDQRGRVRSGAFSRSVRAVRRTGVRDTALRVTGRVEADGQMNCEKLERVNRDS